MSTNTQSLRQMVIVRPPHGLHLGPCSVIAKLAMQYQSSVLLSKGEKKADAKSVFDMMTLEAHGGDELELQITGDDAAEAMAQFVRLFDHDFFSHPAVQTDAASSP